MALENICSYDKRDILVWDSLVPYFTNDFKLMLNRDNYNSVWPVLKEVIDNNFNYINRIDYKVCDFGCGTGDFAEQLSKEKFLVYACDISSKMIEKALALTKGNVIYGNGSIEFLNQNAPFVMITSIMVFQFINNFESYVKKIVDCIKDNGLIFFAVHNVDYVHKCINVGIKFRNIEHYGCSERGEIKIGNQWIKTFIRSPQWYEEVLSPLGLKKMGDIYANKKAPLDLNGYNNKEWCYPKYYIAWYKKHNKEN